MKISVNRCFLLLCLFPLATVAQQGRWHISYAPGTEGYLQPEQQLQLNYLAEVSRVALTELFPQLPESLTIAVVADSTWVIEEVGNVGLPLSPHKVQWTFDPGHAMGIDSLIRGYFKSTLYHEMHHLARGWTLQSSRTSTNFMDAVIAEGMATAFERDYAGSQPLWGQVPDSVQLWIAELQALSPEAYREYGRWMFQHEDGRKWIGYRAGTYLVDRARERSGLSLVALTAIPTEELLRLAGY